MTGFKYGIEPPEFKSMKEYVYNAEVQLNDGSAVLLDLEEHGWADKRLLAQTTRFTLIPKDGATTMSGGKYPIVVVNIPKTAKPVFRTRVIRGIIRGRSSDQIERKVIPHLLYPEFRVYCIGWKRGSTTVWTWIMPTGDVETGTGDDSWLADTLRTHLNTQVWEEPEPEPEPEAAS